MKYKFVFVVDGEVGFGIAMNSSMPHAERTSACLRSEPIVVEIPESDPNFEAIQTGWLFDGQNFTSPPPANVAAPQKS